MPTVPIPSGPSVAPSSGRLGIQAPEGAFALGTIAQGLTELGHSAQTISDTFAQHAEQIQTINNKAASDDAFVKVLQSANQYVADYKSNNLGMKAYENLPQAFKDLDQQREAIGASLTNPNARAMFDADSRRTLANVTGELSRFASSQRKESVVKSSAAVQEALVSDSVLHPENFTANMSKFMEQQAFLNTQLGLTDAEGGLAARKAYGGAVGAVTKTLAANGDITGAAKFLEDHKEGMDGLVYAQTLAQLRPAMQANDAAHLGDLAVQSALGEGTAPGTGTRAERNQNPGNIEDGPFARSQPGYVGSDGRFAKFDSAASGSNAQAALLKSYISRGTNTIGKIVSKWAPPSENDTEAYIGKVEALTGINRNAVIAPQQVAAVQQAMAQVEGFGRSRGKQSVDSSAGGPMTSFDLQGRANDVLAAAGQYAEQHAPGNAAFRDQVEQRAMSNLNRMISAARDTEVQAYTTLGTAIEQNNIQDQATLFKTVPGAANLWNTLPLTQRNTLFSAMNREQQLAANDPVVQSEIARLTGLRAQSSVNPTPFLNEDVAGNNLLPPKTRLKFLEEQAKVRSGKQAPNDVDKYTTKAMSNIAVKNALDQLGIDRKDNAAMQIFWGNLSSGVQDYADLHGGALPPDQKTLNGIVATMVASGHGKIGGVDAASMRSAFGLNPPPPAEAAAIAAEFRAKGVNPSPEDIQAIYARRHSGGR